MGRVKVYHFPANALVYLTLAASLAACATIEPPKTVPLKEPRVDLKPGDILEADSGRIISFDTLIDELSQVRVIYAGERHTSLEDHRIQLSLLKALHGRNPSVTLAMEMFPRNDQDILDRFSKGDLSESKFLKEARWESVWGYPFRLYRDILEFARDRHIKIVGLNAPSKIVRKIGRTGLASLTSKERSQVARSFHLDDLKHREYVLSRYEEHVKGDIKNFETFYEAQLAWEETMAETLAGRLDSPTLKEQALVLIGTGHIHNGMGVPQFTAKRIDHSYRTVVPIPANEFDPETDSGVADFIWITKRSVPVPHGGLGIRIRPSAMGDGLEILDVIPESTAAKMGVKKGDILYKVNGRLISTVEELHNAMAEGTSVHHLMIKRNGEDVSFTIPR
jgi:uncharacterized iron-regulated protein